MKTDISSLNELQQLLRSSTKSSNKKVFVGFDGFVDKIKKAVKEKQNTRTVYFDSIREFAERILMASGKSGQIQKELENKQAEPKKHVISHRHEYTFNYYKYLI